MLSIVKHKFVDDWFPVSHSLKIKKHTCGLNCLFCPAIRKNTKDMDFEDNTQGELLGLDNEFNEQMESFKAYKGLCLGIGGGLYEVGEIEKRKRGWLKKTLEVVLPQNQVVLQTRSTAVIDTLKEIKEEFRHNLIIVIGFFSLENAHKSIYEPNVCSIRNRLKLITDLRLMGYYVGVNYMPLIPKVNGELESIRTSFKLLKEYGSSFIISQWANKETIDFIGMRIKKPIYRVKWDEELLFKKMSSIYQEVAIPPRIPFLKIKDSLGERERIAVGLRYLYYYHLFNHQNRDAYKMVAYTLSKLSDLEWENLRQGGKMLTLAGVGVRVERIINDFLKDDWQFLEKLENKLIKK